MQLLDLCRTACRHNKKFFCQLPDSASTWYRTLIETTTIFYRITLSCFIKNKRKLLAVINPLPAPQSQEKRLFGHSKWPTVLISKWWGSTTKTSNDVYYLCTYHLCKLTVHCRSAQPICDREQKWQIVLYTRGAASWRCWKLSGCRREGT